MTQMTLDARDTLYVARQQILTTNGSVFAYELLYRAEADDPDPLVTPDHAAARVLTDGVLNVGLDSLTGGRPAFVNLTRALLVGGVAKLLPPAAAVFELHADVEIDEPVVEACRELHEAGHALALGDFAIGTVRDALLPYVTYVKVDVQAASEAQLRDVATYLAGTGIRPIAENVENATLYDRAHAAGYRLFQGHYFCLPKECGAAAVPARHVAYVQLLSALHKPGLSLGDVENLIKHDVSLSYRVLRCINSAAYGLRHEVHSIRQALVLMGLAPIRRWASVWCLAGLNVGGACELVTVALIRGRACELLAEPLVGADRASEMFLVGLCSVLDAMLGRPMAEAIAELPLSAEARAALLGSPNMPRSLLDAVIAHERGEWTEAADAADSAGVTSHAIAAAYTDALTWARDINATQDT
jgi:EAL and modified HD-GYP domain-containing signal transduction protein